MRKLILAIVLLAGFSGTASATSYNFLFSGTGANGVYAEIAFRADILIAPNSFTVYGFAPDIFDGGYCAVQLTAAGSMENLCKRVEFLIDQSLIANHAPVDQILVYYDNSLPPLDFWFDAGTHVTPNWIWQTLAESPGDGQLVTQLHTGTDPNGGLTPGGAIPEPSSLMLLGVGLVGVVLKRRAA